MERSGARPDVPPRVEQLLREDREIEFAVVFGSRAEGTSRTTSDLDVAVKFSGDRSDEQRFRKRCHLSGRLQQDDAPFVDLSDLEELPIEVANRAVAGEFLCGEADASDRSKRGSRRSTTNAGTTSNDGIGTRSAGSRRVASVADPDVVATKLQQIEQYHGELREKQELSKESFLDDVTEQRAVERMFQNVI